MDDWVKLATALCASGGIGTVVIKAIIPWFRRRQIRRIWGSLVDTTNALRFAITRCGCCRVLLIESTNGGGIPGPSNPAKVTVLYDATDGQTRSIAGKWVNTEPDHQYAELLRDLAASDGYVHLVTGDLEPGDLKTLYESDEIAQSHVYRLAATEKAMIYVSYNYPHEDDPTPPQLDGMREATQRLRYLVREYDEEYRNAPL